MHKIKENELELKALQSQITPHFLYNILEIINSLIDMGDDRAGTLVILLSRFFRQGISRGQSILPLKDELKYTNVYLDMQKTILEDRLEITVDIDKSLYFCNVINFLFQPILENTFKHGEFDKDQKIRIKIKAYHRKDIVKIIIRDNGKGMTRDTLLSIRNHITSGTACKNIGLKTPMTELSYTSATNTELIFTAFTAKEPPSYLLSLIMYRTMILHPIGNCHKQKGASSRHLENIVQLQKVFCDI